MKDINCSTSVVEQSGRGDGTPVQSAERRPFSVAGPKDTTGAGGTRIQVARTVQEVEAVRDIWAAWQWNPNAEIDFYLHILRSRPEILRPHVLILYRDSVPVAMLVGRLVLGDVEARLGYARLFKTQARALTFVQGGLAGDLSSENSEILVSEVMRSLREGEADMADFRSVRSDSPFYKVLTHYPGLFMRDCFPQEQPHWSMTLPDRAEEVLACTSGHERRQIRRRSKLLDTDYSGNVRIEHFGAGADLDRMCRDIEDVARKTYQRGLGVGFFDNAENRMHLQFEAERGWLRAYILYVADKPCAFWMGSLYRTVFYSGDVGYDPEYRKYELGKQLLMRVLEDLCRNGAKQMDFGLGDAEWKQRFGDTKWQEASARLFAPTLKGLGINVTRIPPIFVDRLLRKTLRETQILPRIKRLWRDRARKAAQESSGRPMKGFLSSDRGSLWEKLGLALQRQRAHGLKSSGHAGTGTKGT